MDNCKHALKHYKIAYKDYKQNKNIYNSLTTKALCRNGFIPLNPPTIYKKKSKEYYRKLTVKINVLTTLLNKTNNNIKDAIIRSTALFVHNK